MKLKLQVALFRVETRTKRMRRWNFLRRVALSDRLCLMANPFIRMLQRKHVRPRIVRGSRDRGTRSNGLACKCFEGHRVAGIHPVDRGPGCFDLENKPVD